MSFPFLIISSRDGHNFTLVEKTSYLTRGKKVVTLYPGCESDGASIPRALWQVMPPFGPYWPAAYVHDAAYRYSQLTKEECDSLFLEIMLSLGTPEAEAQTIYNAVKDCGAGAFAADRAQQTAATRALFSIADYQPTS